MNKHKWNSLTGDVEKMIDDLRSEQSSWVADNRHGRGSLKLYNYRVIRIVPSEEAGIRKFVKFDRVEPCEKFLLDGLIVSWYTKSRGIKKGLGKLPRPTPLMANGIYAVKEMKIDVIGFNNYICPFIFGHPQGLTAGRRIIQLNEEPHMRGGYGLLTECAG